jgi:protein-disulfide isomerase
MQGDLVLEERDYRTAVEQDGVQGIPTVLVPETAERVVGLADLDTYRRVVKEAIA